VTYPSGMARLPAAGRVLATVFLAGPLAAYGVGKALQHFGRLDLGGVQAAWIVIWGVAVVIAGLRRQWFPCPRCGKPFHRRGLFSNDFSRRCLNCGFRKWQDPLEGSPPG